MSVLSAPTLLSPLLHTYSNNIKIFPSSLSAPPPLLLSTSSSSSSSSSSSFACVSSTSSVRGRKALGFLICNCGGVQGRDDSAASTSREDDDTTLNIASAALRGAGIEEVLDNKVGDSMLKNNLEKNNIDKPDSVPIFPNRGTGRRIAVASTIAAVGLFVSTRLEFGVSLKDLSANATPYEEAIANGMPTVVEFYADWCEVCRELAPDIYKVENQYKDRVNFVMMNVDNTKWEQELDEFGVEGIPHFVFLDKEGNEEGNIVGRLPKQYFLENVDALARGETSVPYSRVTGQYSRAESRKVHQIVDPRSHG